MDEDRLLAEFFVCGNSYRENRIVRAYIHSGVPCVAVFDAVSLAPCGDPRTWHSERAAVRDALERAGWFLDPTFP